MKIHEYQAINLFRQSGMTVSLGEVAEDLATAERIANQIGFPVVLKAQVLVGGRGKAGGVKVVRSKEELENQFNQIKSLNIKGYPVERILVVKALDIKKEFYVAVTIDNIRGDVVIIASAEGGVDIEETAKTNPEKIQKFYLNGNKEIDLTRWLPFIKAVFYDPALQEPGTEIIKALLKVFFTYDCSLAEINPLVLDGQGRLIAADAKINFDDNALYRHSELNDWRDMRYEDPDEIEAKNNELSFVKLDGSVGCIVNGAGLAMATLDIIKFLGGEPANFLDVGGSSNPKKVLNALRIILRNKKVKSILINIFGGITRCDDIAAGILQAKTELGIPIPFVVRLTGTNEAQAKEMLAKEGINTFSTMREAVNKAVQLAK